MSTKVLAGNIFKLPICSLKVAARKSFHSLGNGSTSRHVGAWSTRPLPWRTSTASFNSTSGSASMQRVDATQLTRDVESAPKKNHIYIGTGQYCDHATDERVIVLTGDSSFVGSDCGGRTELIRDCLVPRDQLDNATTLIGCLQGVTECSLGELDFLRDGDWGFGFVTTPSFAVFSRSNNFSLRIVERSGEQGLEVKHNDTRQFISSSHVTSISVTLSEEPYNARALVLSMKSGDPLVTLIEQYEEDDTRDLASLMMDTEWLVKAAGLLCLQLRKCGNASVMLRLHEKLRPDMNPYVAMRLQAWTRLSTAD